MDIVDAKKRINLVTKKLLEMKKLTDLSHLYNEVESTGSVPDGSENMAKLYPTLNSKVEACWQEIQRSVPPGFSVDGNLVRHLSFNQLNDWENICNRDIPRELTKVDEYKKQLYLVEYLGTLHPEIGKVSEVVLNGDIEVALKAVYASLETTVRAPLKLRPSESTVPAIGKAFKDGLFVAPQPENNDSARNFLQGVIGYYRSYLLHNPLPTSRNRIEASLSLFALAHEAFFLFDLCTRKTGSN